MYLTHTYQLKSQIILIYMIVYMPTCAFTYEYIYLYINTFRYFFSVRTCFILSHNCVLEQCNILKMMIIMYVTLKQLFLNKCLFNFLNCLIILCSHPSFSTPIWHTVTGRENSPLLWSVRRSKWC